MHIKVYYKPSMKGYKLLLVLNSTYNIGSSYINTGASLLLAFY